MTITADAPETARGEDGYYVIGEERFRSVTAAIEKWDKGDLKFWSGGLAAKAAFEELPRLVEALTVRDCGRTYAKACDDHDWQERCPQCRCERCQPCVTRWMADRHLAESKRRTDEGSRVHHIVKHWVLTGFWLPADPDIEVYVASFKAFVAEYGLLNTDWELAEARVVNREYMYAGTLDGAIRFRRERSRAAADLLDRLTADGADRVQEALLIVDYKTREKEDRAVFPDMPLQLAPYRFAQTLVLADGREIPMIKVDAAAIIQIRPDATSVELVLAEEPEFATFVSLLGSDGWAQERGKRAIASRTFSYAPSVVKLRAADARRRKKEAEAVAAVNAPDPETPAPTPAERGARAAAAAKRPDAGQVWGEIAEQHGGQPQARGKRLRASPPRGDTRRVDTVTAVLGRPGGAQDEEPPF